MYFDDRAVRVKALFHSEMRSIGTFSALSLGIFGFSDRFATFGTTMRIISVGIMCLAVWFALTADRQYMKYVDDFPPGETRDDLLAWRAFPLAMSGALTVVAVVAVIRKIAAGVRR
jgi:hypothetical protein